MTTTTPFVAYEHPLPAIIPGDGLHEQSADIALPYGHQSVKRWFFDGIKINHTKTQFSDQFDFHKENRGEVVSLSFNLKGNYEILQNGQTYRVHPGQHNIVHSHGYSNTFKNMDLEGESFSIEIMPAAFSKIAKDGNDTLKAFLDRIQANEPAVLCPTSLVIHPGLQQAIQSIIHCPYSGSLKKLFLLSKSIEILVLQAEAYDRYLKQKQSYKKMPGEIDRLVHAREFMEKHMSAPPTLSELSREIGLNEYKLKRGFKALYGCTVFNYLSGFRLEKAQYELQHSEKTIAEISTELGYSSSQHFSNAYKKKFGVSPSQCRKLI